MLDSILSSRRSVLAATGALTLAVAVGACGLSPKRKKPAPTLNTKRVAQAIVDSIKQEKNLKATVSCPPNVPQKKGYSFNCTATTYTTTNGKKTPVYTRFTVNQINDRGNVYYSSPPK
jgi:hypothetical protein